MSIVWPRRPTPATPSALAVVLARGRAQRLLGRLLLFARVFDEGGEELALGGFLAVCGEAEGLRMSKREITKAPIHAGHQTSADNLAAVCRLEPRPRLNPNSHLDQKDHRCATDAHYRPDKPRGATGKSLIVLNPWLSLNQRVPGSSPGAPTKQVKHLA